MCKNMDSTEFISTLSIVKANDELMIEVIKAEIRA